MHPTIYYNRFQEDDDLGDHLSINIYNSAGGTVAQGIAHMKYDKDIDTLVNLLDIAAGTGSPISVHESRTNSNYQVPAGKKFVFMGVMDASSVGGHSMKIWSSATVDTADGTTIFDQTFTGPRNTQWITTPILEVAANRFLTLEHTGGAANAVLSKIIGFETDA